MKTLTFTGHRCAYFYNIYDIQDIFYKPIIDIIGKKIEWYIKNKKVETFISGAALGVDMISFFCVHKLKAKYPNIKNVLAIPFIQHGSNWSIQDRQWLELMKKIADKIIYVDTVKEYKIGGQGYYNPMKFQKRNEYMVDNADYVLALWSGKNSGTKNCISYALAKRKQIDYVYLIKDKENKMKIERQNNTKEVKALMDNMLKEYDLVVKNKVDIENAKIEYSKIFNKVESIFEISAKPKLIFDETSPLEKILSSTCEIIKIDENNNTVQLKENNGEMSIVLSI